MNKFCFLNEIKWLVALIRADVEGLLSGGNSKLPGFVLVLPF